MSGVISVHDCDCHRYAGDTELSQSAFPDQFDSVQFWTETCIDDVLIWMNCNKPKVNTDKTEVMPVGSTPRVGLIERECANIGEKQCSFQDVC